MKDKEMRKNNTGFVIYEGEDSVAKVNVRLEEETVWLTQKQLAEIFATTRENVVQHIKNILQDGELLENRTCKKFLQVQIEGSREVKREIDHYNLDMIISHRKTENEFEIYRQREMQQLESDFDRAVKQLGIRNQ